MFMEPDFSSFASGRLTCCRRLSIVSNLTAYVGDETDITMFTE